MPLLTAVMPASSVGAAHLRRLQEASVSMRHRRPVLCAAYAASCWAYSCTGVLMVTVAGTASQWPDEYAQMAGGLVATSVQGWLLVVQGVLSFMGDVVAPFYWMHPGSMWGLADRVLASSNTLNCCATALVWPMDGLQQAIGWAFVASVCATWPVSKWYWQKGELVPHMIFHCLWHTVPNLLGCIWLIYSCYFKA